MKLLALLPPAVLLAACEVQVVGTDATSVVVEGRGWPSPASVQTAADNECRKRGLRALIRTAQHPEYVFDCVRGSRPLK